MVGLNNLRGLFQPKWFYDYNLVQWGNVNKDKGKYFERDKEDVLICFWLRGNDPVVFKMKAEESVGIFWVEIKLVDEGEQLHIKLTNQRTVSRN